MLPVGAGGKWRCEKDSNHNFPKYYKYFQVLPPVFRRKTGAFAKMMGFLRNNADQYDFQTHPCVVLFLDFLKT